MCPGGEAWGNGNGSSGATAIEADPSPVNGFGMTDKTWEAEATAKATAKCNGNGSDPSRGGKDGPPGRATATAIEAGPSPVNGFGMTNKNLNRAYGVLLRRTALEVSAALTWWKKSRTSGSLSVGTVMPLIS